MTSKEIRREARAFLKGQWVKTSVMLLIFTLLSTITSFVSIGIGVVISGMSFEEATASAYYYVGLLMAYVIQSLLMLGYATVMLKIASGRKWELGDLFSKKEYFLKVLGLILLMGLYITLWTFLFIIPGIIKALSYSMALYIMAEDPTKGIRQCIDESKEMMKGNKGRLFKLLCSYIGWLLLVLIVGYVLLFGVVALGYVMGEVTTIVFIIVGAILLIIAITVAELPFMAYVEVGRAVFYYDISSTNVNKNISDQQIQNSVELGNSWGNEF